MPRALGASHARPDRGIRAGREGRGIEIIIAAAGGAAHLAGVIAAHTVLPVLGVPMQSQALNGIDSLLSTVQMPAGVPVGTLGIGQPGARNAALLAVAILGAGVPSCGRSCANSAKSRPPGSQKKRCHETRLPDRRLCRLLAAQDLATRMDEAVKTIADNNQQIHGLGAGGEGGQGDPQPRLRLRQHGMGHPNTPDTKFRLGSISKQFTAACILRLEEQGKLKVTDPVKKYLPDAPAAWDKITIHHVLTHTAGIPSFTAFPSTAR